MSAMLTAKQRPKEGKCMAHPSIPWWAHVQAHLKELMRTDLEEFGQGKMASSFTPRGSIKWGSNKPDPSVHGGDQVTSSLYGPRKSWAMAFRPKGPSTRGVMQTEGILHMCGLAYAQDGQPAHAGDLYTYLCEQSSLHVQDGVQETRTLDVHAQDGTQESCTWDVHVTGRMHAALHIQAEHACEIPSLGK